MCTIKLVVSRYLLTTIILTLNFYGVIAQTQTAQYQSMIANSKAFYEYLPQGYNSESQTYPLLVFLTGFEELGYGDPSSLPTVLRNGPPKLIDDGTFPVSFTVNGEVFKFIVISPQFISWPTADDIQGVIDYAVKNYRVNTNRIYLTGLSMGGGVTWDYASLNATYANRVAAIVPVSGASGPTPDKVQVIVSANLPVWATHNQDDTIVPVANTIDYVNDINASSPPPAIPARKTIFSGNGHDAWTTTYSLDFREDNLNIYEWMLQFQRGTSQYVKPVSPRASLPGRIEAENYDGMSGVSTESTSDIGGSKDVGWIDTGDWLDYNVTVSSPGVYTANFRVASPYSAQQLLLKNSSGEVLATVSVPQTGDFQKWTTVSTLITLPAGDQTLRISSGNGGWNINWFEFVSGTQTPAGANIPGKIEAENYDAMSGIGTENTVDDGGGQDVGWLDAGDWLDYNVMVSSAGIYTVNFRVASPYTSQQLLLKNSSGEVLSTVSVPQTGDFQKWTTVSTSITLPQGNQTLRIYSGNGGWNINWFEFVSDSQILAGATIPGKIEAENYDAMNGVGTENTIDDGGGKDVGWLDTGDWMDYNTSVAGAGNYTVNFRLATAYSGQQLQLRNLSGTVLGTLNVPQTGGFQTWTTSSMVVNLPDGNQTLRIYSSNGSWNINWMEFVPGGVIANGYDDTPSTIYSKDTLSKSTESFTLSPNPVQGRFSLLLNSSRLGTIDIRIADQRGTVVKTLRFEKNQTVFQLDLSVNDLPRGTYLITVRIGNWSESKRLIKI